MAVLIGGEQGAVVAWDQAVDNVADRLLGLQDQIGALDTLVPDVGVVTSVAIGAELGRVDVGLNLFADGVTYGTNQLTTASAPFTPAMVGLPITIFGHGTRVIEAYNGPGDIEFSGSVIAAGSQKRFTRPLGLSSFTDGVVSAGNTLTSASGPFSADLVGQNVSLHLNGTRKITTFTSVTEVGFDGAVVPTQEGLRFTIPVISAPADYGLEAGGQIIDSHRVPALTAPATMRWSFGDRRRRGEARDVGAYSGATDLGTAFAISFDGAITYAPNDENESIGSPSSTRNIIFGVHGSATQPNWRGFIEGDSSSTYRVFCDRYSDGRVVVLFAAQASVVCTIKSATGATLATTTSASRQQAIIFCVSADGQSLEWGPRYFKMSDTPTPETVAFVVPTGLTVRDDVVLAQMIAGLTPLWPTAISSQNQVVDLDGGAKTFTLPFMNSSFLATTHTTQVSILAKMDPADGSVIDGHWHAPNDGDPDGGTTVQFGIQGSVPSTTTVGRYPDYSFGNPTPTADASKIAESVMVRGEGGYTLPNGFSWAQGSTTEISQAPGFFSSRYPAGIVVSDLAAATIPALWLRRNDCWDAGAVTSQNENRGTTGVDAAGRFYFGVHFNVNAVNSQGISLFPGDTDHINQNTPNLYQQQMICVDGNGAAVWDLEMWDTGGFNSHCQYTGCYVDEDDNEVTFLWRNGASNLPTIDPAGVAWTWDIDFLDGEPYLVTVNKTTGALVRATRFLARTTANINNAGREIYMPRSLSYDPTNDLLRIGLLLRPVAGNPAATLYSQPANAAGNGVAVDTGLSLPASETDMRLVAMAVNPTTHAVDSFEVIAKGSFDFEYPFDVRAK